MDALLERRFKRMTVAYARLLDAYKYGNRFDRTRLVHEAEMLIADAKWGFHPPPEDVEDDPIESYWSFSPGME